MKRKKNAVIIVTILLIVLIILGIKKFKAKNNFVQINASSIDFYKCIKSEEIQNDLDDNLNVTTVSNTMNNDKEKFYELANKTTFLLLGAPNEGQVDYLEYKKREIEFNKFIADDAVQGGELKIDGPYYKSSHSPKSTFKALRNLIKKYGNYGKVTIVDTSSDIVEVKVFLDNVTILSYADSNHQQDLSEIKTKVEFRYFFENIYGEYRLYDIKYKIGAELEKDYNKAYETESQNLNRGIVSISTINTDKTDPYDYSKLEALTTEEISNVYKKNTQNVFMIKASNVDSSENKAIGILVADGYVATTWNFLEKAITNYQYITVSDNNGKVHEIDGFVSVNKDSNIVIIKLKNQEKTSIVIGDSSKIQREDAIISLNSKTGLKISASTGIYLNTENNQMTNLLQISDTDDGSPVFNKNGELVGINTLNSVNSDISIAYTTKAISELTDKLKVTDFSTVKSITFDALKEKFKYNKDNEEVVTNQIKKSKWNKYKKIGNLESNITMNLVKANYYNGIVSIRYQNDISEYISGIARCYRFTEELKKSGYTLTYENIDKCIYQNNKYKITLMDELDYVIIIIAEI